MHDMKCLLTIGYTDILLPDHKDVGKIIDLLSKGVECRKVYPGNDRGLVITNELRIEFEMVRNDIHIDFAEDFIPTDPQPVSRQSKAKVRLQPHRKALP